MQKNIVIAIYSNKNAILNLISINCMPFVYFTNSYTKISSSEESSTQNIEIGTLNKKYILL